MALPALIYTAVNWSDPAALRGWAIPAATDIAFAVGVLAVLGSRVPASLKIFMLAIAILDDLGAIIIIAVFYTENLSWFSLAIGAAGSVVLWLLNVRNVTRLAPYALTGLVIWVCVLKSGVHATLAGVIVAFAIPLTPKAKGEDSLLEELEHNLHPWVSFAVLPLFAFANAGVSLQGSSFGDLLQPIPFGIAAGLFVGKTAGIFMATWLAIASGLGAKPAGATWVQVLGVSMLGGIGFTMSLFIGMLAFPDPAQAAPLRLGVLAGSLISALAGYMVLRASGTRDAPGP